MTKQALAEGGAVNNPETCVEASTSMRTGLESNVVTPDLRQRRLVEVHVFTALYA